MQGSAWGFVGWDWMCPLPQAGPHPATSFVCYAFVGKEWRGSYLSPPCKHRHPRTSVSWQAQTQALCRLPPRWMPLNQALSKPKETQQLLEQVSLKRGWLAPIYLPPFTRYTCLLRDLQSTFVTSSNNIIWLNLDAPELSAPGFWSRHARKLGAPQYMWLASGVFAAWEA